MYRERAVIGVLGPTRVSEARAERIERQAVALGAALAQSGYGAVLLDDGFTAAACRRGLRQHDGLAVDARSLADEPSVAQPLLATMHQLLSVADALMILPGDVRSLALALLVWSWGAEPNAPYRQVILVGEGWVDTVRHLAEPAALDPRTRAMVTFATEVPEAVEALRYYVAPQERVPPGPTGQGPVPSAT